MKARSSNKFIWFELGALLTLVALISLWAPTLHSTAQQGNRQLKREQTQPNGAGERRVALVIGNGAYTKAKPLSNPANDAVDIAKALKEVGFEVLSGTDLSKRQMVNLIRDFGAKQSPGGVGLFYYAGHGIQVGGENYLVPVDAEIPQEDEVVYEAVPLGLVLTKMTTAKNDLNIVILDACHNNPFARSWHGDREAATSDGLAKISPPTGTLVLYATEPGKIAVDRDDRNGLFTGSLLRQMKRPNLEYDQMVRALSSDVWEQSNRQQLPWKEGNSLKDFYFNLTAVRSEPDHPVKAVKDETITEKDKASAEREAWNLVKSGNDSQEFRDFLKEFPAGANANNAKIKLEQAVWDAVKDSRDKTRIQAYLNEFPEGANLPLARIRLRQLDVPAVRPKTTMGDNSSSSGAASPRNLGTPSARVERGEEVVLKITYYSTTSWVSHKMSVGLVTVSKTAVTFQPSIDVRGFTVSPDKILELTNPVAWRVHGSCRNQLCSLHGTKNWPISGRKLRRWERGIRTARPATTARRKCRSSRCRRGSDSSTSSRSEAMADGRTTRPKNFRFPKSAVCSDRTAAGMVVAGRWWKEYSLSRRGRNCILWSGRMARSSPAVFREAATVLPEAVAPRL